jgi:hypothetical protein
MIPASRLEEPQLWLDADDDPVILASGYEWDDSSERTIPYHFVIRRAGEGWDREALAVPFAYVTGALDSAGNLGLVAWNGTDEGTDRENGLWSFDAAGGDTTPVRITDTDVWEAKLGIGSDGRLQAVYINNDGVWYTSRARP